MSEKYGLEFRIFYVYKCLFIFSFGLLYVLLCVNNILLIFKRNGYISNYLIVILVAFLLDIVYLFYFFFGLYGFYLFVGKMCLFCSYYVLR